MIVGSGLIAGAAGLICSLTSELNLVDGYLRQRYSIYRDSIAGNLGKSNISLTERSSGTRSLSAGPINHSTGTADVTTEISGIAYSVSVHEELIVISVEIDVLGIIDSPSAS